MQFTEDEYWILISKYLSGQCTDEEEKRLFQCIDMSPENRKIFDEALHDWQTIPGIHFEGEIDQAWEKVKGRTLDTLGNKDLEKKAISLYGKWTIRIAATLLLFAGIYSVFSLLNEKKEKMPSYTIYAEESVKRHVLPDSSIVWLNKHSAITIYDDFNVQDREVLLSGEGFFHVKKSTHPFLINTPLHNRVKVLGTSFLLKTGEDSTTFLQVLEGVVKFSVHDTTEGKALIVKKGEAAIIDNLNNTLSRIDTVINVLSWKDQELRFVNSSLSEIFKSMERYFHIEIIIKDPAIAACKFTGTFNDPSLTEVSHTLEQVFPIHFNRSENRITVTGTGCNPR
jgi:transmembrane sensor